MYDSKAAAVHAAGVWDSRKTARRFPWRCKSGSVGPVVVIDLAGKLMAGDGDGRLKDKINSLVQQERRQILLNVSGLSYIDSNGLGELVASHTTVSRHGGHIKLAGLTKRVQDLLAICRSADRLRCL